MFQVTQEEVGTLSTEHRPGRGLHTFLARLASRMALALGMERLALLEVDQDRTVRALHLFFSVTIIPYTITRWLLACSGKLLTEGMPTVTDLSLASFTVRRAVGAVLREDHILQVEGIFLLSSQMMQYERARKTPRVKNWLAEG